MITYPDREPVGAPRQASEAQRRMIGIMLPEAVILTARSRISGGARGETVPRNDGLRLISRSRRPLAKSPRGRFVFGLSEQEVQPAGRRIPIQLFIPPGLFKRTKPRDEAAVIFRRQAVDGGLDLFNPVHALSLASRSRTYFGRGHVNAYRPKPQIYTLKPTLNRRDLDLLLLSIKLSDLEDAHLALLRRILLL